MGLALASYVVCQLAGQPIRIRALQSNITDNLIHKLYVRLENTERKASGIEYVAAHRPINYFDGVNLGSADSFKDGQLAQCTRMIRGAL